MTTNLPDLDQTRIEIQLEDPLYEPVILTSLECELLCGKEACSRSLKSSVEVESNIQAAARKGSSAKGFTRHCKGWRNEADKFVADVAPMLSNRDDPLGRHPEKLHRILREYGTQASCFRSDYEFDEADAEGLEQEYATYLRKEESSFCVVCGDPLKRQQPGKYELDEKTARRELYHVYENLLGTFEMRRLMGLQMTGFLSYKYPSSTHTRFAHCLGTWIAGIHALDNITVNGERLILYLFREDIHREFMASLMLHDIGHAPFSHVLEMNPHLDYDHERIADELLTGGASYQELEDILVSCELDRSPDVARFGAAPGLATLCIEDIRCGKQGQLLVKDVCDNMALDAEFIAQLFSRRQDKPDELGNAAIANGRPDEPIDPAVRLLRGLVNGPIDIDRIDHIYRDLHYNSFRMSGAPITTLFRGLRIEGNGAGARMNVREEALPVLESVLSARELASRALYDSPVNNFYIAVFNKAVSDGVRILPLLKRYLPFMTDEGLLQVLMRQDLFHNLSPTKYASLAVSSCLAHQQYDYCAFQIRRPGGKKLPTDWSEVPSERKLVVKGAREGISDFCETHDLLWCAWLKDVRAGYLGEKTASWTTPINIVDAHGNTMTFQERLAPYVAGITAESSRNRAFTVTLFREHGKAGEEALEIARSLAAAISEAIRSNLVRQKGTRDDHVQTFRVQVEPLGAREFLPIR